MCGVIVCAVWCVCCLNGAAWHAEKPPCVGSKRLRFVGSKRLPCVPAKRVHVFWRAIVQHSTRDT